MSKHPSKPVAASLPFASSSAATHKGTVLMADYSPADFVSWLRPGWHISLGNVSDLSEAVLWRPAGERPSQGFRVIAEHRFTDPTESARWVAALDALTASGQLWKPRASTAYWMLPNPPPGFTVETLLNRVVRPP